MITGSPMSSTTASASSSERAVPDRGTSRPISTIASLNSARSSAVAIASALAPIISGRAGHADQAPLEQLHGDVQAGLAAERRQHGVGPLAFDDRRQHLPRERLDVGGIGEVGIGHDRRRVRVGEDDAVALLLQHPARLGAGVVELAGLPDHDRAGADDQDRVEVVAPGHQRAPFAGHHLGELVEQVVGVVRAGVGLGVVLHAVGQLPRHLQALAHAVVQVDVGHRGPIAERAGVDGEVVVLARDLDPATGEVLHRVVAPVVAERHLHRVGTDRPRQQLVAEADPEDGHLPEQGGDRLDLRASHIAGSPGPLLRKTPSGASARMSAAEVAAGTTSTVPSRARWRPMLRFIP